MQAFNLYTMFLFYSDIDLDLEDFSKQKKKKKKKKTFDMDGLNDALQV